MTAHTSSMIPISVSTNAVHTRFHEKYGVDLKDDDYKQIATEASRLIADGCNEAIDLAIDNFLSDLKERIQKGDVD